MYGVKDRGQFENRNDSNALLSVVVGSHWLPIVVESQGASEAEMRISARIRRRISNCHQRSVVSCYRANKCTIAPSSRVYKSGQDLDSKHLEASQTGGLTPHSMESNIQDLKRLVDFPHQSKAIDPTSR